MRRRGGQRGQEQGGDRGVDRDTADPQVPGAAAVDELAGAGAVVAGRGFAFAVVVDGEFAAAGPAGDQPLQQGATLPHRAGAGLMRGRADVGADPCLVGQVGVPVDESLVVVDDADLPLVAGQHLSPHPRCAVGADVAVLTGPAEDVGAGVGGVGQDVVHRVVGRVDPDDLGGRRDVAILAQRQLQPLVTQPQPYRPHRTTGGELLEDRGEDAADGLVGVFEDLSVGLTPDQPDRQPDAQFAASGLGADAAVEAGPQNVQFGLRHGVLSCRAAGGR